jgi:hypothetical protein
MKKFKFLYLDDEKDETTEAIVDGLKINDLIDITYEEPKDFKDEKKDLEKRLKDFDGIILDLRLDGRRLDISYNAPAIAQELRMMAGDKVVKSCPIILCSTDEKMRATYDVEKIYHELFDYKFTKQGSPPWLKFATKLASLANGYEYIVQSEFDLKKIMNREDLHTFDPRIFEVFNSGGKHLVTFDYASFIIKDLFHHPGILIKENLLAARLGIDIEHSPDWKILLDSCFAPALFTGAFSDGWNRWWTDRIIDIFKDNSTGKRPSLLNAEDRVVVLKDFSKLSGLQAAKPLEYNKSSKFWTICEAYKAPLDPIEGYKIHSTIEPKSWQEDKYISLLAVLNKKIPRPHSSEEERIRLVKEELLGK